MVLAFGLALFFLFGCQSLERDNVYDPDGMNYVGEGDADKSSSSAVRSSSSGTASSSSLFVGGSGCSIDGYRTVEIGEQTWMAENLNCEVSGSKCFGNDPVNCDTYGRLYNWETAKAVCPQGWHLPSDADWTTLINYVGEASTAGSKLKATSGWTSNGNGTDTFGFTALPGGYGDSSGGFDSFVSGGNWWSSTKYDTYGVCYLYMYYGTSEVFRDFNDGSSLISVRCLKDN